MLDMNESLTSTARICFQSAAFSPNNKQMDSHASLTGAGGFAIDLTSANCFFLIPLTANYMCNFLFNIHFIRKKYIFKISKKNWEILTEM
jgi:hypothetical protein